MTILVFGGGGNSVVSVDVCALPKQLDDSEGGNEVDDIQLLSFPIDPSMQSRLQCTYLGTRHSQTDRRPAHFSKFNLNWEINKHFLLR